MDLKSKVIEKFFHSNLTVFPDRHTIRNSIRYCLTEIPDNLSEKEILKMLNNFVKTNKIGNNIPLETRYILNDCNRKFKEAYNNHIVFNGFIANSTGPY